MTHAAGPDQEQRAAPTLTGLGMRLCRHWWPHVAALAAACGVVAATIAGALGVGHALRAGLHGLAVARLGGIRSAVLADGWFREALAEETSLRMGQRAQPHGRPATRLVAAIVMEVTLEAADDGGRTGATVPSPLRVPVRATLLACDEPDALGFRPSVRVPLTEGTAAVNEPLARGLGVAAGMPVVLRAALAREVPGESPLGRRSVAASSRRLTVAEVLPPEGLGRFSLRPTQVTGGLVVTDMQTARFLERERDAVANCLFEVAAEPAAASTAAAAASAAGDTLRELLRPTLEDLGLELAPTAGGDAWRLTSRRLLLAPEVDRGAARLLCAAAGRPTLVFLFNELRPVVMPEVGEGRPVGAIPYSTVVGVDATALPIGGLFGADGAPLELPGPDEIVIDRWMADDLATQGRPVGPGDEVELRFFLPETLHGRVEESACRLRVAAIAEMRGLAVARELVPEVEGITDEDSIADWDPPFPFDRSRIRATPPHDEDDRYWKRHGATPKAFVSLETARRLAGSRFGVTTAWFVPAGAVPDAGAMRADLAAALSPAALGMRVVPLRAEAEAAARGSTPFGLLFLALSSFLVVAGLILEGLVFSLLVAARRRDIGILSAVGWPAGRVERLLLFVGALAAAAGVVVGTLVGPPWAAALLGWLATAWDAAVATGSTAAFGTQATALSPALFAAALPGAIAAGVVSLVAVAIAARRAARMPPLRLLRGPFVAPDRLGVRGRVPVLLAAIGPVGAVALAALGRRADAQAATGLFFGSGIAALVGLLAGLSLVIGPRRRRRGTLRTLAGLAWRGLVQERSRAFAVATIVAVAEFLIVAVAAFALRPSPRLGDRHSPTGGWTHIATFGVANGIDPADAAERESLGLSEAQRDIVAGCAIARVKSSGGDDASCTNLYAATRPTVLGLGPSFVERGGFSFVGHAAPVSDSERANPWTLLQRTIDPAAARGPVVPAIPVIPAILDQATALWALKLGGVGARFELPVEEGRATCEIVGLLEPGILQGAVLVSEANFARLFPRRSGYSMALVDAGAAPDGDANRAIVAAWADAAATVVRAPDRLRALQGVQNTFLAAFQALGTLGLALGTAGVAAVQIQGVIERRATLGLLAATGFTVGRLRRVVVLETMLMVLAGLAAGTLSGCLAVAPAFVAGSAALPLGWIAASWGLSLAAALLAGLAATGRVARLEPGRLLAAG
jgi:putative ABC transport system permease protein